MAHMYGYVYRKGGNINGAFPGQKKLNLFQYFGVGSGSSILVSGSRTLMTKNLRKKIQ
jgi:hypothetical protein